jgi:hypothetical protein
LKQREKEKGIETENNKAEKEGLNEQRFEK